MTDRTLEEIVADAVRDALDSRRRAVIVISALTALLVALLVSLVTTIAENSAASTAARRNSAYNCGLLSRLAGIEAGFIASDARDRKGDLNAQQKEQVMTAFAKIIQPRLLHLLSSNQERLDSYTIGYWQGPRQHRGPYAGQEPLLTQTQDLARVNCNAALK